MKTLVFVLMVPLLLPPTACAAHYTIHPGSLNKTDSALYDTLLIAEAAIDQARIDYQAGQRPADSNGAKAALDALIKSYNIAREFWLTYRGAIATNVPPDAYFNQLNKNLSDLTNAIRTLHERLRMQARREAQAR